MLRRKDEKVELTIIIVSSVLYLVFGVYFVSNQNIQTPVVNTISVCGELG